MAGSYALPRSFPPRRPRVLVQRPVDLDAVSVADVLVPRDDAPPDAHRRRREIVLRKALRDLRALDDVADRRALLDLERNELLAIRQREHDLDVQRAHSGSQP